MKESKITITHPVGLHARPAALFVQTAKQFTSKVSVSYNNKTVNAKSILSLLTIGASKNAEIVILADGPDEEAAVNALTSLVADDFGEHL